MSSDFLYKNVALTPDIGSFRILPWLDHTASVLCNINDPVIPIHCISPRQICSKQLEKLTEMGYDLYSAFEYEFYLVDKDTLQPIYNDNNFGSAMVADEVSFVYSILQSYTSFLSDPGEKHGG